MKEDDYEDTIWVAWNDCIMADYIAKKIPKGIFEYTVEVKPPELFETTVKSVMYHTIPDFQLANNLDLEKRRDSTTYFMSHCNPPLSELDNKFKYKVRFDAADIQGKEINITIATELDGKTVTQVNFSEKIKIKEATNKDEKEEEGIDEVVTKTFPSVNGKSRGYRKDNNNIIHSLSFDIPDYKQTHQNTNKTQNAPSDPNETKLCKERRRTCHNSPVLEIKKDMTIDNYKIRDEKQDTNKKDVQITKRVSK